LIDAQKLSYTEYAGHLRRIHPLHKLAFNGQFDVILDWAWECYGRTQIVYASANEVNKHYEYVYHYKSLWEESIVAASEHLAALLNYIYK
jgi:hypothetical protein